MKVSVSLSADDVQFLDEQTSRRRFPSRSAVVTSAIQAMRLNELTDSYIEAFDEWAASGDAHLWDSTLADGFAPASSKLDGGQDGAA